VKKDAIAVVLQKDGAFLLIKRAKKGQAEDYWCPITGAVEPGETQPEAVIREAREEMGLEVRPSHKVWQCYTQDKQYMIHWWCAELTSEHMQMNTSEVKEYRWLHYRDMQKLDKMFEEDLYFFKLLSARFDR
jgi:8-oxo-dGTP pyrophosphatase MutT (NUDIX family)